MTSIEAAAETPSREAVMACLDRVIDPCSAASASPMSIVEMGLIRELRISDDGAVNVSLRLSSPSCYMVSYMASHAKEYISELAGVRSVEIDADAGLDWDPSMISPDATERRRKSLDLYMSRPSPV